MDLSKDTILELIDSGTWQHSCDLPKSAQGGIDWYSTITERKVLEVLKGMRNSSLNKAAECNKIILQIQEYPLPKEDLPPLENIPSKELEEVLRWCILEPIPIDEKGPGGSTRVHRLNPEVREALIRKIVKVLESRYS